jgi:hypothetical protein
MKKLVLILSVSLLATFCKKGDTGGNANITAYVTHHGKAINLPTVYVKFDAKDLPKDPTTNYDLKLEGVHENHVHIKDLRYGNYYLYAVGYDSSIMLPVTGGIPVTIKWKERRSEKEVTIPVTE